MTRIIQFAAFALALLAAHNLVAQDNPSSADKPSPPWAVDRSLTVSPQSEPSPALKYRLIPPSWELTHGNAVPIYLRLTHEESDAARKHWTETPKAWNQLPVKDIPLDDVRKFFQEHGYGYFFRQLELGARRRTAEWDYTLDEPNPIGLLLPDVSSMRTYEPMLVLKARMALAEKDFAAACHHLETGFAFSRHVGEGPTLIHSIVAIAMASQFADTVADFNEQPDSPNLYWALAALPQPLVDLRAGLAFEYQTIDKQFPELVDLDRERTAEQWDNILRHMRTELRQLDLDEQGKLRHPEWYPKDCAPEDPAAKSPDLATAREYVARTKGLAADQVEKMPPAQVLLSYVAGTSHEDRDDWHKATYLPYAQARPVLDAAAKRLRDAPVTEGHVPARMLLSALDRVVSRQNLLERNIAALRVIEALRLHAAGHDGKLPDKLSDVTEVPIPHDPGTGQPFDYQLDGDTAILVSQLVGDPLPNSGLRYRVTIRK
jgi:hypothetical protein